MHPFAPVSDVVTLKDGNDGWMFWHVKVRGVTILEHAAGSSGVNWSDCWADGACIDGDGSLAVVEMDIPDLGTLHYKPECYFEAVIFLAL